MATRHDRERQQRLNEKHKNVLAVLLSREENKYCADCLAKGPRWASWNLGVLLCIRCSGLHRSLGVHISRVKSVNLDTWTKDQMLNFCCRGNGWAKEYYEANLPKGFKRPQSDSNLEYFIRDKYEKKKYISSSQIALRSIKDLGLIEETPPDLPQKTRKRDPRSRENIPIAPIAKPMGLKPTSPAIPRPRSLPQLAQHGKVEKTSPLQGHGHTTGPNTDDLLGLSSPPPSQPPISLSVTAPPSADLTDDLFGPMSSYNGHTPHMTNSVSSPDLLNENTNDQTEPSTSTEAVADKKMSKDSILSLYSQGATPSQNPMISSGNFNMQNQNNMGYQQQAPMQGFQNMQNMNAQGMQAAYASQQQQAMVMQQQLQMQQMTQQMANANISAMPNMTGYQMMGSQGPGNPMQNNMAFNMGYNTQGNPQAYVAQQPMYAGVQNGNPGMVHNPAMVQMGGYNPTIMAAGVGNVAGQQGASVSQWGAASVPGAGVGMNSGHTLSTQLWK